ncbi:hypothetical protein [uncultured Metabacillus sp.]|uniref:hypothetical protein n=1 Tax=uncultured Metabacillus sp. TaxID=2860135 RepID=UPI00263431DA|nr:hypothetical protein [uncultured Metabacillus sp.]
MVYFRRFLYIATLLVFLLTVFFTLYYGKETFHFSGGTVPSSTTSNYHIVLIPEELDNDY